MNDSGRANRVAPDCSLHAVGARGLLWGNRGPLLDRDGRLTRHAQGRGRVCCVLEFHGRRRDQWRPGRGGQVLAWSFDGYADAQPRGALPAVVRVQTPEPTVAVLRAGFVPGYHPSASSPA